MGKSIKGSQTEKNLLAAFAGESQARNRYTYFASAARITRLSTDPDKGMAGRCVQGLIDVIEENYGGDISKMPYVVNKEAFKP